MTGTLPNGLVGFGPDANCTLALCPIEASIYQYRPSLGGNVAFSVFFGIAAVAHAFFGIRWKSWGFMSCMIVGSAAEIGGYVGRVMLYENPFDFISFMIQFLLITVGPVFYTAAIYITLSSAYVFTSLLGPLLRGLTLTLLCRRINHLAPELSRFNPKFIYWVLIPVDVICLLMQFVGGYLAEDQGQVGVNICIAGLVLQVAVIVLFSIAFGDYIYRYIKNPITTRLIPRVQAFLSGLAVAVFLILLRSTYRAYELSQGFIDSDLLTDEAMFIGLEGV